ncbi:hypothetical protein ANCCEY_00954 [Ancylostoma ceylanicum]|uniref:G-protein coupled receptors family 1 profile domain-containing protein n=1 Tax=Ancylostoma ceylanicum TaxID=53326 RepID=A0A0D6M7B0_9BILA|nr:hypothetical protein ANCCEY_00954 [Ancylostoma ceylanicum]
MSNLVRGFVINATLRYRNDLSGDNAVSPEVTNLRLERTATMSTWERRDDLIVVSIWLVMLSYALISNVLILVGIARSSTMRTATRQETKQFPEKFPFNSQSRGYWFIISLAVCDIVMTIISLVHLVPATAFHDAYVEFYSLRNILMIFFYDLFWYTGVVQLGLMAGNRFVSIVYPMEYKNMFSRKRSLYLILFGYFLGFLVSLPTLFPCCHTLWNSDYYITVYQPMDTWYKYVDMSVNSISLFMMIMSYAVIIYKVRESGRAMAKYQLTIRTRQQHALMSGISLSCQMNGCTRMSSVRPPRSQVSKKEMRLFIQVNPTVYLLFNTQLRRELHYLLCRHHAISSVQNKQRRTLFGKHTGNPADIKTKYLTCNATQKAVVWNVSLTMRQDLPGLSFATEEEKKNFEYNFLNFYNTMTAALNFVPIVPHNLYEHFEGTKVRASGD